MILRMRVHLLPPLSEEQKSLRTLSLRGCPEVDDWFLARLHVFQDSLEELDISRCPRITTGGLAALRNLKWVFETLFNELVFSQNGTFASSASLFVCVWQGTAASGRVGPPWDLESRVAGHPAGGDVTAVPGHRYRLRAQPEPGEGRGDGRVGVGNKAGTQRDQETVFQRTSTPVVTVDGSSLFKWRYLQLPHPCPGLTFPLTPPPSPRRQPCSRTHFSKGNIFTFFWLLEHFQLLGPFLWFQ